MAGAEMDCLKGMIMSFRISELCTLLSAFKKNIKGRKSDLQVIPNIHVIHYLLLNLLT
jgi:hypothetical protein